MIEAGHLLLRSRERNHHRKKAREQSLPHAGKNPARIQWQQINAEIRGRIRDAITHLTSLPLVSYAAQIARIARDPGCTKLKPSDRVFHPLLRAARSVREVGGIHSHLRQVAIKRFQPTGMPIMLLVRLVASLLLLLNLVCSSAAGTLDAAMAAYGAGNYADALRLLKPLAQKGQPFAQYTLGYMFAFGKGVPKNQRRAVKWIGKAADQGLPAAEYYLGLAYSFGRGVPKNYTEAAEWFSKAAHQDFPPAQYHLGEALAHGTGVPKNLPAAVAWYRKSAIQGYADAQATLGGILMFGKGEAVPLDYDEAIKWDRLAANQNNQFGQLNLGLAYAAGDGVPQDYVLAYMWLNIASAKGGLIAGLVGSPERKLLERQMTQQQIAEAQDLARRWKPKKPHKEGQPSEDPSKIRQFVGTADSKIRVPLKAVDGVLAVPVELNGAVKLDFTVDSGAADVSIPSDVFSTLRRTGTIKSADLLPSRAYLLADGSKSESLRFRINSLKIGGLIIHDVPASVSNTHGLLLLGQSFLERFKSWSIDNNRHELDLEVR